MLQYKTTIVTVNPVLQRININYAKISFTEYKYQKCILYTTSPFAKKLQDVTLLNYVFRIFYKLPNQKIEKTGCIFCV